MGQILHGSAKTTHAVRAAIQRSKASIQELASRYDLDPKTVMKWRKRAGIVTGIGMRRCCLWRFDMGCDLPSCVGSNGRKEFCRRACASTAFTIAAQAESSFSVRSVLVNDFPLSVPEHLGTYFSVAWLAGFAGASFYRQSFSQCRSGPIKLRDRAQNLAAMPQQNAEVL
jgi:hypothetical protein